MGLFKSLVNYQINSYCYRKYGCSFNTAKRILGFGASGSGYSRRTKTTKKRSLDERIEFHPFFKEYWNDLVVGGISYYKKKFKVYGNEAELLFNLKAKYRFKKEDSQKTIYYSALSEYLEKTTLKWKRKDEYYFG